MLLYNEVDEYKKDLWKKISVHDEKQIRGFFGDYRFLSNFYQSPVLYEGLIYPSSENAFQAAKVEPKYRNSFLNITALESKSMWRKLPLVDRSAAAWDDRKYDVMYAVVLDKFTRNEDLKNMLLTTGNKYLEERLWWKDIYWGYDYFLQKGENNLGKILMRVRDNVL